MKKTRSNKTLVVFQGQRIRRTWHNDEWWFVIADIVKVLTDSTNPRQYIKNMRKRDEELSKGWVQIEHPLLIDTVGDKRFTSLITKNKTYPLKIIIDSLTLYNRLNTLEETADHITERHGITITPPIILKWLKEYRRYTPFLRMREFAAKKYSKLWGLSKTAASGWRIAFSSFMDKSRPPLRQD